MKGQISFWDKQVVEIINDCTWINPKLQKGSKFRIFLEQTTHWIILLDGIFYGIYKTDCKEG